MGLVDVSCGEWPLEECGGLGNFLFWAVLSVEPGSLERVEISMPSTTSCSVFISSSAKLPGKPVEFCLFTGAKCFEVLEPSKPSGWHGSDKNVSKVLVAATPSACDSPWRKWVHHQWIRPEFSIWKTQSQDWREGWAREEGLECPFCGPWSETVTRQKMSPKRPGTSGSDGDGFRREPCLIPRARGLVMGTRKEGRNTAQNKIRTSTPQT